MATSSSSFTLFNSTLSPSSASSSSYHQLSPSPNLPTSLTPSLKSTHTTFPALSTTFSERNARVRVRIRAEFKKKMLDTPGAYELVDEKSGKKVIVWGDETSVPSEEVLSWKPEETEDKTSGGTAAPSIQPRAISPASTQIKSKTFGRLKVQKMRNLLRKSEERQQTYKHQYEEVDVDDVENYDQITASQTHEHQYEEVDVDDVENDDQITASDSEDVFVQRKRNVKSGIEQLRNDQVSVKSFDSNGKKTDAASSVSALRSKGWGDRGPRQSFANELNYMKQNRNYSANSDFFSRKFFKDLPCSEEMINSLNALGFLRASNIQAMAYAPAFEGKSCIIADQSGSGKTLAYLAPLIQRLRQEEIKGISKSASYSPRAVVLVPTAELASQVLGNCRSISKHGVPFRSMVATGGFRQRTQLESLKQNLDLLIATPGRFSYLIKEGFLQLANLRCAVLDEVDILFDDEEFEQALRTLMTSSPLTAQYLFVTATLPVEIYNKLVGVFPDCEVIMGPGVHRTSSRLEEVLVDCSGDEGSEKTAETAFFNKKSALLKLVQESPVPRTIIFCNKIETCRQIENALRRFDRKEQEIRVLPFHAALQQETRQANMKEFLSSDTANRSQFLICTDRASRGIDFPSVNHVVLFDFPRDPSEYVRRVGRTARGAGGKGKAFIFVVGKQVSLARRTIDRNLKGHPLHEVPSAYELSRF